MPTYLDPLIPSFLDIAVGRLGPIIWFFVTLLWLLNCILDTIDRYKRWRRRREDDRETPPPPIRTGL